MANNQVIHIVGTKCQPQVEEKFNKWYNEVHIPLLKKYKGLKNVARYKVAGDPENMPVFIAIYTFASQKDLESFGKSPEFAAAITEMNESWPSGFEIVSRTQYNLIKEWV